MKTVRCFLAVNLELKAAKKISELQQQLIGKSSEFKSTLKWVPPQNMHVTVRFLGNITEPMIQAIKDGLEPITQSSAPFLMETASVGVFDADALRVLHMKIADPSGGMTQLVTQCHELLENIGFKKIDRTYTPHVTLARIKDGIADEIEQLIADHADVACGSSLVRDLACYESKVSQSGVDYHLLWKLPLQKRMPKEATPQEESSEDEPPTENEPSKPCDVSESSDVREPSVQGE
ncbi:MAG: RNA 2',3'-cyclic phosphodiesterase [Deltaproteobacteria bacterium]|nr:RNA 2',3'-cyclic phosphodiesterase [Deltaproteobacteria bacterium]MBN2672422.1 RNA 2',3'-cyclic phosphodiesterase [Deltaproteobacteria bacterium]